MGDSGRGRHRIRRLSDAPPGQATGFQIMPAQLIALTDGPNILLDKPILLIGRHPECDILIDSRKVSRRHCCIAQVTAYLVVRDLGRTNGTRFNGVRAVEGRLKADDELSLAGRIYRVALGPVP